MIKCSDKRTVYIKLTSRDELYAYSYKLDDGTIEHPTLQHIGNDFVCLIAVNGDQFMVPMHSVSYVSHVRDDNVTFGDEDG